MVTRSLQCRSQRAFGGQFDAGLVLVVILAGFWASGWQPIGAVPLAVHVHAPSSCTWLTLLIVQGVASHRRSSALH